MFVRSFPFPRGTVNDIEQYGVCLEPTFSEEQSGFAIRPAQVWAMLQMQRTLILLFAGTVVLVSVIMNVMATRQYQATAVIHLSTSAGQEVVVDEVVDADQQYLWNSAQFYRTQFDIMRSRGLLKEVVRRYEALGYDDLTVEDGGAGTLAGVLSISQRTSSELVDISVVYPDPERAAVLANLVTEVYEEANLDARREAARAAREWLQQQLEEYRTRIRDEGRAVLTYQAQSDLADAEEVITELSAQMEALNRAYGELNTQVVLQRTQLENHERLLKRKAYDDLVKDMDTPLVESLTEEYSKALSEHARIAARYGERHPERQSAADQLARIEAELQREIDRTIAAERAQLAILEAKEASILSEIEAGKQQLLQRQEVREEYDRLTAELARSKAFYETLSRRNDELEMSAQTQLNNVRVIDAARPNPSPVEPRMLRNVLLSALAGLFGGCALGLLREYVDDTISSPLDVATYLRVPYLGLIPKAVGVRDERALALYTHEHPGSAAAEAMRGIRTMLELSHPDALRRLVVTSTVSSEGKTTTSIRLGVAFANLGRKAILVDADLRRPRLHKVFDLNRDAGLSSVVTGELTLEAALHRSVVPGLDVLPAGPSIDRPNELLASKDMIDLLARLEEQYDIIIIDTPPAGILSDAALLSKHVDGVVMVVREHTISRMLVKDALQRLQQVGANLLGVAVNAVDMGGRGAAYKYYYGYQYRYDKYYVEDKASTHTAAK